MNTNPGKSLLPLKIVILGDFWIGKRAFVQFLKTGKFIDTSTYISRDPGAPIESVTYEIEGKFASIFLFWNNWSSHKPPIDAIRKAFYMGTKGVIVLYDITQRPTFEHVQDYIADAANFIQQRPVARFILGNKVDLGEKREVAREEGQIYVKNSGGDCMFSEISCKTGSGVKASWEDFARRCLES